MKDIVAFASGVVRQAQAIGGHSDRDWQILGEASDQIIPWGRALSEVYAEAIHSTEETSKVMEGVNRSDHQHGFAVWYENLVSGAPGEAFWAETCLIGLYHATAGVQNQHVIAMAGKLEEEFVSRCASAFDTERAAEVYMAFKRVLAVALAVMVDSYHHAIMRGMEGIGMNERLVTRIRKVAIRRMIDEAREVLPLIDWNPSLSVGIGSIDEQHQKLVLLLNSLHDSSAKGTGNGELKRILGELVNYTVEHFAYEEKLFEEHGYPEREAHRQAHIALTSQVGEFNEQFQAGNAKLSADLFKFLRTWLNGHIRGTDKLYSPYLLERGVR